MDKIGMVVIAISQMVIVICILIIFWQRKNMKTLVGNLEKMIEDATKGTLKSKRSDGTIISDLEVKMNQYLKVCIVRNRRAKEKKDTIKSLIAEVAFQTQAPLADVTMYSDMLVEQKDLPEDTKKIASRIHSQGEKLHGMLESLVKISVLESGLNSIKPKTQNVGNLLCEVSQELLPMAEKKGIAIHYKNKKLAAVFDYPWTLVAITNILENAIRYSKEKSLIKVSLMQYDMYVRIDITDNGIGIPYSETEAIFKKFYRGKNAKNQEGLGIGLYLARHIIREQCGFIKVSSMEGKGSMFSIFLPRV